LPALAAAIKRSMTSMFLRNLPIDALSPWSVFATMSLYRTAPATPPQKPKS
jgi:hypothetical protein